MPCVLLAAMDFGLAGQEGIAALEADAALKARIEAIRLQAGPMMGLGDVAAQSIPKMILVSPPAAAGCIATRSFIPHRVHDAIGVFAALSVATACLLDAGPAARLARVPPGMKKTMSVEHPTGAFSVIASLDAEGHIVRSAVLRTARKLFDGIVF